MDGAGLPCSVSSVLNKPDASLFHKHRIPCRTLNLCVSAHTKAHYKNVSQSQGESHSLRSYVFDTIVKFRAFNCFNEHFGIEKRTKGSPNFELFSAELNHDVYTEEDIWMSDLEFEVFQFMETSENPFSFPTQSELLKAGRDDLVDAILREGGWLASGWDSNPCTNVKGNVTEGTLGNETGDIHTKAHDGQAGHANECAKQGSSQFHSQIASFHTELNPAAEERQRAWDRVADLFGLSKPLNKSGHDGKILEEHLQKSKPQPSCLSDNIAGYEIEPPQGFKPPSYDEPRNLKRKIIPRCRTADNTIKDSCERMHELDNARKKMLTSVRSSRKKRIEESTDPVSIAGRVRGLEAELTTTLQMLKSGRDALVHDIKPNQVDDTKEHSESVDNVHEVEFSSKRHREIHSDRIHTRLNVSEGKLSLHEIEEASDELEFRETELLRKRRELREAQAKLTVSEGKLSLQLTELQRNIEDKDKRLNEAISVLKTMRTARIVWPNPAVDVFLAGSFDGWTSQRKMERSNAGVFVTSLQLYPGRYEIKFIVNGEWKVDHNRPITGEGGFENNVLVIV